MPNIGKATWRMFAALGLLLAACGPAAGEATHPRLPPTSTPPPTVAPATTAPPSGATASEATPTPQPTPTQAPSGAQPKHGGILKTYFRSDPTTWEWAMPGGEIPLRDIQGNVFTPLGRFKWPEEGSCDFPLEPVGAQGWQWLDDTHIDLTLRKGIKFHNKPPVNGREATTEDVVFFLKRLGEWTTVLQPIYDVITDISARDRYTVRMSLSKPQPGMPLLLFGHTRGNVIPAPESAGPDGGWAQPAVSWIGTGPQMFDKWTPGVKAVVKRNPDYFEPGLPYIDGIEFLIMPDMSTQLASLRSGRLDILFELPIPMIDAVEKAGLQIRQCPKYNGFMSMWMRTDKQPFNDVRVRRAMSMAIDRDALVQRVLQGRGEKVGVLPPHHPYAIRYEDYPPEIRKYMEFNPTESERLLAEAGVPAGLDVNICVGAGYANPQPETNEAIAAMLQAVGFKVRLDWKDRNPFRATCMQREFDQLYHHLAIQDPPWQYFPYFHSTTTTYNRSRLNDPELDRWIDQFITTTDPKKAEQAAREFQLRMVDQAYVIYHVNSVEPVAFHPWVRNFGNYVSYSTGRSAIWTRIWLSK